MADASPSLELLCELSELERLLAARPDAQGYRKLAAGYAQAGWPKEAARADIKAKALLANPMPELVRPAQSFSGACNPGVLVELLRALHETGKSGQLELTAPGGIHVSLALDSGQLVDAQSSDTTAGEPSLFRAVVLRAARYVFLPGVVRVAQPSLQASTPDLLAALAARRLG